MRTDASVRRSHPRRELMTATEPRSKQVQDPKKREAILEAALHIFARRGIADTDVQLIATDARVGKGTIYRYFGNKRALFLAVADEVQRRLEEAILALFDDPDIPDEPEELMRAAARAYSGFFRAHPDAIDIVILERAEFRGSIPDTQLRYRARNRGRFEDLIRRGIEQGRFRAIDVAATLDVFADLFFGTVVSARFGGQVDDISARIQCGLDLLLAAITRRDRP